MHLLTCINKFTGAIFIQKYFLIRTIMIKTIKSSEETGAPLSQGKIVNGIFFVSGQVHLNYETKKLEGESLKEKFELTVKNIEDILRLENYSLSDVVSVKIFLTDISELPELNKYYLERFSHPLPTRAAVAVSALPLGASLEIECIAAK